MLVHLAVAGDVFDGVLLCDVLPPPPPPHPPPPPLLDETWNELSQFLRNFLPTAYEKEKKNNSKNWSILKALLEIFIGDLFEPLLTSLVNVLLKFQT